MVIQWERGRLAKCQGTRKGGPSFAELRLPLVRSFERKFRYRAFHALLRTSENDEIFCQRRYRYTAIEIFGKLWLQVKT